MEKKIIYKDAVYVNMGPKPGTKFCPKCKGTGRGKGGVKCEKCKGHRTMPDKSKKPKVFPRK